MNKFLEQFKVTGIESPKPVFVEGLKSGDGCGDGCGGSGDCNLDGCWDGC